MDAATLLAAPDEGKLEPRDIPKCSLGNLAATDGTTVLHSPAPSVEPVVENRREVVAPERRAESGERLSAAWVTGAHGSKSGEQQVQMPLPYITHLQREPPEPAHREALEEFSLIGK